MEFNQSRTTSERFWAGVYYRPNRHHHLGRPFLTAYQLAIEYDRRFPELCEQLGFPVGGAAQACINLYHSGWREIYRSASEEERSGTLKGGFLSDLHRADISFNGSEGIVRSSVGDISIFRLINSD